MKESSSVQVAVRVRPMLGSEAGSTKCIETLQSSLDQAANVVRIGGPSGPTFVFDQAFDGRTPQEFVFQSKVLPLIERCLEGYNATVLAYGQTGSGKTHTIMGPSTALEDGESAGLIPRAVRTLFARLSQQKKGANKADDRRQESENDQPAYDYEVRVQFLELYGEVIRDLLTAKPSSEKLTIRDIGNEEPEVLGATQLVVESAEEALLCLTRGMMRRVTAETAMNATSSRSHAILSVMVHQTSSVEGHTEIKRSKFSFVDLAGSERLKRTHAQGQRMKEGVDINKGLLVLGNVISRFKIDSPAQGFPGWKPQDSNDRMCFSVIP
jgi:Kinesin motor domain